MDSDPFNRFYFEDTDQIICNKLMSPITDDFVENLPSVVDRFFNRFYYVKTNATDSNSHLEAYSVLFHSNRVCLIGLANCHPALTNGVESITFDIGNTDRSQNKVTGKGKKGGMILQEDSTLAILMDKKGNNYRVPSCVRGKLIEINSRLLNSSNSKLLSQEGYGYVAIVLPKPEHCAELKEKLLTQENYNALVEKQKVNGQV